MAHSEPHFLFEDSCASSCHTETCNTSSEMDGDVFILDEEDIKMLECIEQKHLQELMQDQVSKDK